MPMLTAEIASTTAKPSMILPRNRKVGSLGNDIDCGQMRFNDPTRDPHPFSKTSRHREAPAPEPDPES